jgi:hypothetical protein
MGSATESLTDATGCHLVPMYQVIGLSVTVALLILLLVSILRIALDIVIRVIEIPRARSCGWWLMGAFWGILLQVAAAPVQWAMAKRDVVSKAAGRDTEDKNNGGGLTPAEMRLLTRSSPDGGSVLIHLDQQFIERGPCRSERERTLEIIDSAHIIRWLSPSTLFTLIRTPGVTCCYLPLLQTGFRVLGNRQRVHQAATSCLFDPEIRGREQCLRGSQEIFSLQEILEINTNNKNQELISKG